jgi:hypothetical protein
MQQTVEFDTVTYADCVLHSTRTRRVTRVPVTHVNTMARVPMYFRLTLSTRALVFHLTSDASVRVSSLYLSHVIQV